MADKQHYVKVTFEWGNDEDGEFTPKNSGDIVWVSMPYENSVVLQNAAILPAINMMIEEAGKLGLDMVGGMPNAVEKNKPGKPA
jgi:hypothetical protein